MKFQSPEEAIAYMEGNHGHVSRLIEAHPDGVIGLMRDHPAFCQDFLNNHVLTPSVPASIGIPPPPPPPPPMDMLPPPPPSSAGLPGNGVDFLRQLEMAAAKRAATESEEMTMEQRIEENKKKSVESPGTDQAEKDDPLLLQIKQAVANVDTTAKRRSIDQQLLERKQAFANNSAAQDGDRRRSLHSLRKTHPEADRVLDNPVKEELEEEPQEASTSEMSVSKLKTLFENQADTPKPSLRHPRAVSRRPSGKIARKRSLHMPRIAVVEEIAQEVEVKSSGSETVPQALDQMGASTSDGGQKNADKKEKTKEKKRKENKLARLRSAFFSKKD